jgi:hypothetical protein
MCKSYSRNVKNMKKQEIIILPKLNNSTVKTNVNSSEVDEISKNSKMVIRMINKIKEVMNK